MDNWNKFDENEFFNMPGEALITNGHWVDKAEVNIKKGKVSFNDGTGLVTGVTHWMPVPDWPKPPKGEDAING